ncbi:hypothetical protein Tco_0899663 [Tanacetum coccineum]
MDPDIQKMYSTLEDHLFHERRYVTPSFIEANNMLPPFQELGLESFLKLNEPICPRFVIEFYHSLEFKRNSLDNYFNNCFFGHDLEHVKQTITILRTTRRQLQRDPNTLFHDDLRLEVRGWELFIRENMFSLLGNRDHDFKKTSYGPMSCAMLLTRLFKHILSTNPQSIVPFDRFMYHERVMISLDISRKTIKDKGKRAAPSSSSSSSSSNEDEDPSSLQFYEELSDDEEPTNAQKEKRGMFKCLNHYFITITK